MIEEPTYTELCVQPYSNCSFSAGFVEGAENPVDTMYFKLQREGEDPIIVHMRPDEMSALAWVINGAVWSHSMNLLLEGEQG